MPTCYENIRKPKNQDDDETFYKILDYFNEKNCNNINKYNGGKK